MTYLEKYMKEHSADNVSGVVKHKCPGDGYWATSPKCLRHRTVGSTEFACMTCWNQEIPEDKPIAKVMDVKVTDANERRSGVTVTAEPSIKDSGDRTEFATGAVRDMREGKGRCDLMPLIVVHYLFTTARIGDEILFELAMFQQHGTTEWLYRALVTFAERRYNNCIPEMLLEVAKHFEEGAKKYGENNWQKGIPTWCYIDSAIRHYLKWLRGDKDEPHDRAFVWNLLCCIWTINSMEKPENHLKTAQ